MSQHWIPARQNRKRVYVLIGWDRPLQGYFLVIETGRPDEYVYSNLSDRNLSSCGGLPKSLDYFEQKLTELNIKVPKSVFEAVREDGEVNRGNRYVRYVETGGVEQDSLLQNSN